MFDFTRFIISSVSLFTLSSSVSLLVSMLMSACSGSSKGALMPVKFFTSPRRARAYKPFTSLRSHSSIGVLTYTSMKSSEPTISRAMRRRSLVGLTKQAKVTMPVCTNSLPTSAILRMFSLRSSAVKPRLLLIPALMLSPSRMRHRMPRA